MEERKIRRPRHRTKNTLDLYQEIEDKESGMIDAFKIRQKEDEEIEEIFEEDLDDIS